MRMIGLKTCNNLGAIYYLSFSVITFAGSRLEDKLIELFTTQSFTRSFKSSTPPQYSRFQQITLRHRFEERDYILGSSIRCKKKRKKEKKSRPQFLLHALQSFFPPIRSKCQVCTELYGN